MRSERAPLASDFLRRLRPGMGTFVEIGVERTEASNAAVDAAFAVAAEVERSLSFQDFDSELSRLNRAGATGLTVSAVTARVVRLARAIGRASGNRFNATVGGALVRRGILPDHGGPEAIDSGSWTDIRIHGRHVGLARAVRLTLDGIAKGFAVDEMVRSLRSHGVNRGWVNAGGDLRSFGDLTLRVSRREADGRVVRLGGLREASLATSVAGAREDLAPGAVVTASGGATESGTWSVIARHAWRADALTKVAALTADGDRASVLMRLGGRLAEPLDLRT